ISLSQTMGLPRTHIVPLFLTVFLALAVAQHPGSVHTWNDTRFGLRAYDQVPNPPVLRHLLDRGVDASDQSTGQGPSFLQLSAAAWRPCVFVPNRVKVGRQ